MPKHIISTQNNYQTQAYSRRVCNAYNTSEEKRSSLKMSLWHSVKSIQIDSKTSFQNAKLKRMNVFVTLNNLLCFVHQIKLDKPSKSAFQRLGCCISNYTQVEKGSRNHGNTCCRQTCCHLMRSTACTNALVNLNSTATSRESKYTFYSEAKHKQYEGNKRATSRKYMCIPSQKIRCTGFPMKLQELILKEKSNRNYLILKVLFGI